MESNEARFEFIRVFNSINLEVWKVVERRGQPKRDALAYVVIHDLRRPSSLQEDYSLSARERAAFDEEDLGENHIRVCVVSAPKIPKNKQSPLMGAMESALLAHIAQAHTNWTGYFVALSSKKAVDAYLSKQIFEVAGLDVPLKHGHHAGYNPAFRFLTQ